MLSTFIVGGTLIALHGYSVAQTTVTSLFQITYDPAQFQGNDEFSRSMRGTLQDISSQPLATR